MKIGLLLIFIVIITSADIIPQPFETKSSYISVNLGGYKSSLGHKLSNRYAASLTIGAGFGYALSVNSFLYSKLTYFTMPKFQAYEDNSHTPVLQDPSNLKKIKASFRQYIFDLGLQQNYKISNEFIAGIVAGPSIILFNQETHELEGALIQSRKNNTLVGYFAGITAEKQFRDDAVTIFGEIQYNHSFTKKEYQKIFNGINYTVGLRFYLSRSDY